MLKTLQWVYKLGIAHERRRIKLLIERHNNQRPDSAITDDMDKFERQAVYQKLDIWSATNRRLQDLIDPRYEVERRITDLGEEEL